mmetsp:Transcript_30917/g.102995  ORF Transcript_30917/g.102995 Transcript_30917/m.102995 type:complete len:204 (+) Transcript_30917:1844-2455(+)
MQPEGGQDTARRAEAARPGACPRPPAQRRQPARHQTACPGRVPQPPLPRETGPTPKRRRNRPPRQPIAARRGLQGPPRAAPAPRHCGRGGKAGRRGSAPSPRAGPRPLGQGRCLPQRLGPSKAQQQRRQQPRLNSCARQPHCSRCGCCSRARTTTMALATAMRPPSPPPPAPARCAGPGGGCLQRGPSAQGTPCAAGTRPGCH